MLHIILLILKIIGILLLSIIGLLLVILLTVLLVPIRYKLYAEHGETFRLEGRVSWLLHLINAKIYHLEGVLHIRVQFLWFLIYDNLKPKQHRNKPEKNANKRKKDQRNVTAVHRKNEVNIKEHKQDTIKNIQDKRLSELTDVSQQKKAPLKILKEEVGNNEETIKKDNNEPTIKIEKAIPKYTQENPREDHSDINKTFKIEEETETKNSIFQRILIKLKNFKDKVKNFFIGVKNKVIKWFDTVANIKHKISLISDFIKDELNREGFKVSYNSLKKLFKHIKPTKLNSKIVFGTGDPCSTGQALGLMGILYSFYGDHVQITPDFENKRFEGRHYARGRIRLITILIIVIKLIMDKRFKQLKSNFQILKEAL